MKFKTIDLRGSNPGRKIMTRREQGTRQHQEIRAVESRLVHDALVRMGVEDTEYAKTHPSATKRPSFVSGAIVRDGGVL